MYLSSLSKDPAYLGYVRASGVLPGGHGPIRSGNSHETQTRPPLRRTGTGLGRRPFRPVNRWQTSTPATRYSRRPGPGGALADPANRARGYDETAPVIPPAAAAGAPVQTAR